MNKKALGVVIPLGVVTIGGIALKEEINKQCNYMLNCCTITIDGIEKIAKEIQESNLSEDEKAKICNAIVIKMKEAVDLVRNGRAAISIFKRKRLYKQADKLLNDLLVNLTINNYGWLYN